MPMVGTETLVETRRARAEGTFSRTMAKAPASSRILASYRMRCASFELVPHGW